MVPKKEIEWAGSTWELLDVGEMVQLGDVYKGSDGICSLAICRGIVTGESGFGSYYRKKKLEQGGIVANKTYAVNPDRAKTLDDAISESGGTGVDFDDTPEHDIDIHQLLCEGLSKSTIDIPHPTVAQPEVRSALEIEGRISDLNEMIPKYGLFMSPVRLREIVAEIRALEWVLKEFER